MTPIRVGVIGCGRWGRNLIRSFSDLGVLAAICDRNPSHAQASALQYGVPAMSLDEMLGTGEIGAVAIATPADLHSMQARQALLAGKHAFVEKPLALTITDAGALKSLAERERRVLMVGHVLQYHPAFVRLMQMLSENRVGALSYIHASRLSEDGAHREWNTLWGMASHDISMILSITGELPDRVTSRYAKPQPGDGDSLHALVETTLEFPNGIHADIITSGMSSYKEQRLAVKGARGTMVFDDCLSWENKLILQGNGHSPITADNDSGTVIPVQPIEPLRQECRHFLDMMEHGGICRTGPDESIAVLCVLETAEVSLRLKRTVKLTDLWETTNRFWLRSGVGDTAQQ